MTEPDPLRDRPPRAISLNPRTGWSATRRHRRRPPTFPSPTVARPLSSSAPSPGYQGHGPSPHSTVGPGPQAQARPNRRAPRAGPSSRPPAQGPRPTDGPPETEVRPLPSRSGEAFALAPVVPSCASGPGPRGSSGGRNRRRSRRGGGPSPGPSQPVLAYCPKGLVSGRVPGPLSVLWARICCPRQPLTKGLEEGRAPNHKGSGRKGANAPHLSGLLASPNLGLRGTTSETPSVNRRDPQSEE